MNANNKPFMESYRDQYKIGDIISWKEWDAIENLG